jgi:ABC-type Na+ efflux pump permease subunit
MKLAEKYDEILESQSIEKLYVYKINNISMPEQLTPRNYAIISRLIILFTYCLIRVFSRLYGITISKERKYKTLMIISNTKLSHKDIVLSKILATSIVGLILSGLLFVVTYLIGLKEILILNYFLINYIISFLILLILINVLIMSISFCAKKPTIYINTITIFMWVLYFVITLNNDIISHYLSLAPIISAFTIIINLFSNNVNSFYIIYSYGTSLIIIMLLLINTIKKLSNEALYNELD